MKMNASLINRPHGYTGLIRKLLEGLFHQCRSKADLESNDGIVYLELL